MTTILNEVRTGFYLDSVALMQVSSAVTRSPGVEEAALMMGTPSNIAIMTDAGILNDIGMAAHGGDLVLAVRADSQAHCDEALSLGKAMLDTPRQSGAGAQWRPRSIAQAAAGAPAGSLALVSVAGEFAVTEARAALQAGLHVMIFSDNVSVEDERALKEEGRQRNLLVMGPDCGTSIVSGTPLAFANVVTQGDVGIIGASGTGIQEVSSLIANAGGGVSHALGVGGRDLSDAVGGITTRMAIDALDADSSTREIVLISKPPSPEIAADLLGRIGASAKRWTICFIGAGSFVVPDNAQQVYTLEDAALCALGEPLNADPVSHIIETGGELVGLFTGGTLCAEAQSIAIGAGMSLSSNVPVSGVDDLLGSGHRMIDFGSDEYTVGRAHPMIDPTVRDDALREALRTAATGVVLVDCVLGYGASADPARSLIDAIGEEITAGARVVASITGTDADPQERRSQLTQLTAAGVHVEPSNAAATRKALALVAGKAQ